MKSFRMEKTSGNADVTKEALMWVAVLVFIVGPLLFLVYQIAG